MKIKYLVVIFLIALVGCNQNVQMNGTVTFSDNGEPLEIGTVVFANTATQASGQLTKGGNYTLGSLGSNDGIPKGEYTIFIEKANQYVDTDIIDEEATSEGNTSKIYVKKLIPLIHSKHTSMNTSELKLKVDGSTNTFDIKVDRPLIP
jgi:hypothetical protein